MHALVQPQARKVGVATSWSSQGLQESRQSTVQASADAAADEEVDYDEADDWDED